MFRTREWSILKKLTGVSFRPGPTAGGAHTLSNALVYLLSLLWVSLRESLIVSKEDLTGFWSLARVIDAWCGSGRITNSYLESGRSRSKKTNHWRLYLELTEADLLSSGHSQCSGSFWASLRAGRAPSEQGPWWLQLMRRRASSYQLPVSNTVIAMWET